jgi:hypothetical protein
MTCNPRAILWLALVYAVFLPSSGGLRADGGTVRLREQAGAYQVTVFTSPTPFRAGPVDVSVLVQDAAGECVPEASAAVRLSARGTKELLEYSATAEAATNKLFHAAVFPLPRSGWWDIEIVVEGPHGPADLRFDIQAGEPLPRWRELWPWFIWPAFVVALFGLHQALVRRKTSAANPISRRHSPP